MQLPYRKPGKYSLAKPDNLLTAAKFDELQKKHDYLKNTARPRAAEEVNRLAAMGDFSENAEYQIAKGRLRGINQRILELDYQLKQAEVITPQKRTDIVGIGSIVTIKNGSREKTYHILGSAETDPTKGIISHTSPLGVALLRHKVGDEVDIKISEKQIRYKIVRIE